MCLVPTHMTFVHMNSINETLDIFLQIFMKEMQSIYIFQRHMIHCYILSFTYMLDGCNIKPCEAHQKFKHACLVFGKREFVFNDTVESNRNIARSFLSSWESFFSTWRKGPSGFSVRAMFKLRWMMWAMFQLRWMMGAMFKLLWMMGAMFQLRWMMERVL